MVGGTIRVGVTTRAGAMATITTRGMVEEITTLSNNSSLRMGDIPIRGTTLTMVALGMARIAMGKRRRMVGKEWVCISFSFIPCFSVDKGDFGSLPAGGMVGGLLAGKASGGSGGDGGLGGLMGKLGSGGGQGGGGYPAQSVVYQQARPKKSGMGMGGMALAGEFPIFSISKRS